MELIQKHRRPVRIKRLLWIGRARQELFRQAHALHRLQEELAAAVVVFILGHGSIGASVPFEMQLSEPLGQFLALDIPHICTQPDSLFLMPQGIRKSFRARSDNI